MNETKNLHKEQLKDVVLFDNKNIIFASLGSVFFPSQKQNLIGQQGGRRQTGHMILPQMLILVFHKEICRLTSLEAMSWDGVIGVFVFQVL